MAPLGGESASAQQGALPCPGSAQQQDAFWFDHQVDAAQGVVGAAGVPPAPAGQPHPRAVLFPVPIAYPRAEAKGAVPGGRARGEHATAPAEAGAIRRSTP